MKITRFPRRLCWVITLLLNFGHVCTSHATDRYFLTDIGTLAGPSTFVYGLSSTGLISGYSFTGATVWKNGVPTSIGALAGPNSVAYGANAAGDVVGVYYPDSESNLYQAFLYRDGAVLDLAAAGGATSWAFGVNDAGVVTGYVTGTAPAFAAHAFRYENRTMTILGEFSSGQAINSSGVIAGYGLFAGIFQAFTATATTVTPLGTPNGTFSAQSYAYAISESGEVAGWANADAQGTSSQAMYSKNGALFTTGLLDAPYNGSSFGHGINFKGVVVGSASRPDGSANVAFLFDGKMYDLNSLIRGPLVPYVLLTEAQGINDEGVVLASGIDSRSQYNHGYLLTPVKPLKLSCPEATAVQGSAYASALVATGGAAPYTFSIAGALPSGLSLNAATGAILGIPTVSGMFSLTFGVADAPDAMQGTATEICPIAVQAKIAVGTLAVYPEEVRFGEVRRDHRESRFVAIFNTSAVPVAIRRIHVDQDGKRNRFMDESWCPSKLLAHGACAVLITLDVHADGKVVGTLVIDSDATRGRATVLLEATVIRHSESDERDPATTGGTTQN